MHCSDKAVDPDREIKHERGLSEAQQAGNFLMQDKLLNSLAIDAKNRGEKANCPVRTNRRWRAIMTRSGSSDGKSRMKTVFDACSNLEAHMAMHQLQQAGIHAEIVGEYLHGGFGELPVTGMIRVVVEPKDEHVARQVIADWETNSD